MKYNLLLVANDLYFKLLFICIKSIISVCNTEKLQKIFIADIGLSEDYRKKIEILSNKIEFINTGANVGNSKTIYSKSWINAVSQKTAILLMLVESGQTPIVMIDSDTIVIDDFSDIINSDYDIQICKRAKPFIRPDGLLIEYIASFFTVNNSNGINFLNSWIKRLEERINQNMIPPHETPALTEIVKQNTEIKIGIVEDKIVSCENNYFKGITRIIHAKGRTKNDRISIFRFANIRRLPYRKVINLFDRKDHFFFSIMVVIKKIFPFYDLTQKIKYIIKKIINK